MRGKVSIKHEHAKKHPDRRVIRTRGLLETALWQLIREKGYDELTIQDITARANVGRATFYLHYQSKDDLFMRSHLKEMDYHYYGVYSKEELLADTPPQSLIEIFRYTKENRVLTAVLGGSKDGALIMKQVRQALTDSIMTSLQQAFPDTAPTLTLDLLVNYLVGSRLSLMTWWLENRTLYSAEEIAAVCHRLQRAAIVDAFGLR
jgi:AcrR family transcriptional regulator